MKRSAFAAGLVCGVLVTTAVMQSNLLTPAAAGSQDAGQAPLLYELRTYHTPDGRLDDLNARFRNHTMALFEKHGMQNIIYWTPVDKPNTLIYVIAHKDKAAADASWDAFRNDPEWKRVSEETQRNGKLVERVEAVYLTPTDYSPRQ